MNGGLHPSGLAHLLERVLQGQAVHHGGEHAHVVGLGTVHPRAGALDATPDVAATDDDGDVDVEVVAGGDDVFGDGTNRRPVDAVFL